VVGNSTSCFSYEFNQGDEDSANYIRSLARMAPAPAEDATGDARMPGSKEPQKGPEDGPEKHKDTKMYTIIAGTLFSFLCIIALQIFAIVWTSLHFKETLLEQAYIPAFLATIVSGHLIVQHLLKNRHMEILQCEFRMMVLIPIYAMDALACLHLEGSNDDFDWSHILTVIRDILEAIVLTSFVQFLIVAVGETDDGILNPASSLAERMLNHPPSHAGGPLAMWSLLPHPIKFDRPFWLQPGPSFVAGSMFGLLQYVIAMLVFSIMQFTWWYHEKPEMQEGQQFYDPVKKAAEGLKGASCAVAMYHLLVLATNLETCEKTKEIAHNIQLEAKFLCLKGVIFLTLFQKMIIKALYGGFGFCDRKLGLIMESDLKELNKEQSALIVENFLLCYQLLLFSCLMVYAFPPTEFNRKASRILLKTLLRRERRSETQALTTSGTEKQRLARCQVKKPTIHELRHAIYVAEEAGLANHDKVNVEREDLLRFAREAVDTKGLNDMQLQTEHRVVCKDPVYIQMPNKDYQQVLDLLRKKERTSKGAEEDKEGTCCRIGMLGHNDYKCGSITKTLLAWSFGFMRVFNDWYRLHTLAKKARSRSDHADGTDAAEDSETPLFRNDEKRRQDRDLSDKAIESHFKNFDINDDGELDKFEVHLLLSTLGYLEQVNDEDEDIDKGNVHIIDIDKFWTICDKDQDGLIQLTEFKNAYNDEIRVKKLDGLRRSISVSQR